MGLIDFVVNAGRSSSERDSAEAASRPIPTC